MSDAKACRGCRFRQRRGGEWGTPTNIITGIRLKVACAPAAALSRATDAEESVPWYGMYT